MPPRRQSDGKGGGRRVRIGFVAKVIGAVAALVAATFIANYAYFYRADIARFFSTPKPPDAAAIDKAVDEAYARIKPVKVTTSVLEAGTARVKCDRVTIAKKASILRANCEITEAVEGVGGRIVQGVESADAKGKEAGVTLSVSDGSAVVREIRLERSKK
jgi:hypothetical protein